MSGRSFGPSRTSSSFRRSARRSITIAIPIVAGLDGSSERGTTAPRAGPDSTERTGSACGRNRDRPHRRAAVNAGPARSALSCRWLSARRSSFGGIASGCRCAAGQIARWAHERKGDAASGFVFTMLKDRPAAYGEGAHDDQPDRRREQIPIDDRQTATRSNQDPVHACRSDQRTASREGARRCGSGARTAAAPERWRGRCPRCRRSARAA